MRRSCASTASFFIEDLQSRNGTYVNNGRIRQRQELSDEDRITLCDVVLVFHDERKPSSATSGTAVLSKTTTAAGRAPSTRRMP